MKAIRVAVSAAGIAAMVAVVASGQMALVAADGELSLRSYARSRCISSGIQSLTRSSLADVGIGHPANWLVPPWYGYRIAEAVNRHTVCVAA
jgi:hypothetical protein